jgi:hypothetical protein
MRGRDDPEQNLYMVVVQDHDSFVGVLLGVHDGAGDTEGGAVDDDWERAASAV